MDFVTAAAGQGRAPGPFRVTNNRMSAMLRGMIIVGGLLGIGQASALAADQPGSPTLAKVRAAGALRCGVVATPEDWNRNEFHGPLAPLSTEICKAVAVAALGEKASVQLKAYTSELDAEQGLQQGEVDLAVGVTPEATAMWHWNIAFGPPVFYDGQTVLVRPGLPADSLKDLADKRVCAIEGTDTIAILQARTVGQGIPAHPTPWQEEGEMEDAFAVGHCDAVTADLSLLAQVKAARPQQDKDTKFLPVMLTLSPAAPAYRQDDPKWAMLVDWTIYALIQAEASGVTQENVASKRNNDDPVVQRLIGDDWATSRALGLTDHYWAAKVIAVVGNYGEIYDRTVGAHSALRLPRGLNALWSNGGLMHPLPVQ